MPSQRDKKVDTRGSMSVTLTTCLLLATVVVPGVEGNCTVVVNGAQGMPGPEGSRGPPGVKEDTRPQAGGAVYTRWGRMVCPQGAALVYAGRAAGSKYNMKGGTSDSLCMPETPQYLSTDTTATAVVHLRGVEFETFGTSSTPFKPGQHQPCGGLLDEGHL